MPQSCVPASPQVFFGGVVNQEKQRLVYRQNFRGCIENIYFNGAHIADLARRKKSNIRFEVRGLGREKRLEDWERAAGKREPWIAP